MKYLLGTLISLCVILQTEAVADETQLLIIHKSEGTPPRVDTQGVDLIGAAKIHQLLGEDFVVFHNVDTSTAAVPTISLQRLTAPGKDPILPICQCPEDYVAGLQQRLNSMDTNALLSPKLSAPPPGRSNRLGTTPEWQTDRILPYGSPYGAPYGGALSSPPFSSGQ